MSPARTAGGLAWAGVVSSRPLAQIDAPDLGVTAHLGGRALGDEPSLVEHADALGDGEDDFHVVLGEQQREASITGDALDETDRLDAAQLTRDDVVRFHAARFRPDATIIAVVGAVTLDEARREILARFGAWPRPAVPPARVPDAAPGPGPREEKIARDLTQSTIMFGRQAIRQTNPDYFPLTVASYVLGGGSASRLYARVREQNGLAYAVYSHLSPARYGAAFIVSAQTRTAEVARVTAILKEELARMIREPVSEAELGLAKSYLIGSFPLRLDTSGKVADFISVVEELGLGLDYPERYKERVGKVTTADVQGVAAKYFDPVSFNRVVVGKAP